MVPNNLYQRGPGGSIFRRFPRLLRPMLRYSDKVQQRYLISLQANDTSVTTFTQAHRFRQPSWTPSSFVLIPARLTHRMCAAAFVSQAGHTALRGLAGSLSSKEQQHKPRRPSSRGLSAFRTLGLTHWVLLFPVAPKCPRPCPLSTTF